MKMATRLHAGGPSGTGRPYSVERVLLVASVFLALFCNTAFWHGALAGRSWYGPHTWLFTAAVLVMLVALHFLVLGTVATQRTIRPLLTFVLPAAALADHYMRRYGVVIDATMLRSVARTDWAEARELITWASAATLLVAVIPMALLKHVHLRRRRRREATARRAFALLLALFALLGSFMLVFQDMASLMRTHKALRYTINPAGPFWSLGRLVADDARAMRIERDPPEALRRTASPPGARPRFVVVVVGETARAANFSLNGYARPTNPELARLDVINFASARSCGTSTEVSLPCMFSPFGRHDYDEDRIKRHESLLHVLARAGYKVVWVDNQSGCKGVCTGLETRDVRNRDVPDLCNQGRCHDGILVRELQDIARAATKDTVVVLHQIGNHGPAYYRRYPPAYKRFTPACERDGLRDCSREEILNAYDNAIAYTDKVLADVVRTLDGISHAFDVAMFYASDHGESLGEGGLYLHGVPYFMAPAEQTHIPFMFWLSQDFARDREIDTGCVNAHTAAAVSHDNVFHSMLGLLDVETTVYHRDLDLFASCRDRASQISAMASTRATH